MKCNLLTSFLVFASVLLISCKDTAVKSEKFSNSENIIDGKLGEVDDEDNEYDSPEARYEFEFEQTKDPSLGYVPVDRLVTADNYTENQKRHLRTLRTTGALPWTERGPIYDVPGPFGNTRGGTGNNYTAGRTRAILVDTLNDPSGNTVFCGSVAGGLWRCTNFLSAIPNWAPVNDRFLNLAIAYLCQDPSNPNTMYFATGEPYDNSDAVIGAGIWKSIDGGITWGRIAAATAQNFRKVFRIVCDAAGNVYVANRATTNGPSSNANGVWRSKDGGDTWQNITPAVTSGNAACTDLEFSLNGRLHASFGYRGNSVQHQYTDDPANATAATWVASTGIRTGSSVVANRMEMAAIADTLYAVTINSSNNVDSCYKSINGGATWTKQNTTAYTSGVTNTQGWYDLTLSINPANTAQIIVGGLDAYKSTNSGSTVSRLTYWVTSAPYVHADHHFMQWWVKDAESRILIGCDGGVYYSIDAGSTFTDKNRNLAIKQFYAGSIHPDAGSNYMLAGAQDNGVHRFTQPGKASSTEVTGGDGCFVQINQANPQVQFGTYVYNSYRRSTDGGNTWSSITFGSNAGRFVNPFDFDDGQNTLIACWSANNILRWRNANTSTNADVLTINTLNGGNSSAFKVSPFTRDRVFIGTGIGRLIRVENISTVTNANVDANATNITGSSFSGYISCVNTGSSDSVLVVTFSSYGVQHVFVSNNGGASWSGVDGNLPDMPVRWAAFDPQNNNKLYLATEAGVYYTDNINGSSTVWVSDINFPTVRTDMLKIRLSDNTIMAATHGRGVFTALIPSTAEIRFNSPFLTRVESATDTLNSRVYTDYIVNVSSVAPPSGNATVTYSIMAGNTANEGFDFDFTTNGSFSAPSKQHIFTSGAAETKTITIRIYDDAAIESDETFTIGMTVSGATDAFAGSYSTFNFTIKDNDFAPSPIVIGTRTIGTGDYGSYIQPFRSNYEKARSQYIYLASELKAAGMVAGNITSLGFNVTSKTSTQPFTGLTLSLKQTTLSSFSSVTFETGTTPYYIGNYSTVQGINTFDLSTPFVWDGTSNILVEICYDNNTPTGSGDNVSTNITQDVKGLWNRASTGVGCSLPAQFNSSGSYIRPDILFTGLVGNPPDTVLNASKVAMLSPNDLIHFFDNDKILASINNLSGFSYGLTEVKIDRTGNSAQAFWNNNPANYVMNKTYLVTPATNNPSGQYQITLYFTKAEKEGWEAATGNSWNNIQLIKTQNAISNVTPGNPNGAGSVQVVTPNKAMYGTDYLLSYTFSTGFSGFAAGIPGFPLPVVLLDFQGRLNNSAALLTWSTSSEQNSRNFEVEKSTDGTKYTKIGAVEAAGNSAARRDYSFTDDKLSPLNYYRLRMNDRDGNTKLSSVVLVNFAATVQKVVVVNNPFRDYLDIRFARLGTTAKLQLLSATGAVVAEKQVARPSGQIHWNLPSRLSAGSYILRTVVDGEIFTYKLMKQ